MFEKATFRIGILFGWEICVYVRKGVQFISCSTKGDVFMFCFFCQWQARRERVWSLNVQATWSSRTLSVGELIPFFSWTDQVSVIRRNYCEAFLKLTPKRDKIRVTRGISYAQYLACYGSRTKCDPAFFLYRPTTPTVLYICGKLWKVAKLKAQAVHSVVTWCHELELPIETET